MDEAQVMRASILLVLALAACGGPEPAADGQAGSLQTAAGEAPGIETRTTDSPASESRSRRSSGEELSLEYLEGAWCYSRESGGGESGVVIFYADGTFRLGIGGTPTDHYLAEPEDLEKFWENHPVVEVESDRFVALLSGNYRVVYRRAPC